jgi:hypothetical protein
MAVPFSSEFCNSFTDFFSALITFDFVLELSKRETTMKFDPRDNAHCVRCGCMALKSNDEKPEEIEKSVKRKKKENEKKEKEKRKRKKEENLANLFGHLFHPKSH